ncbi:hypothetical protein WN943_017838 [Citrus x changshan-huyou]
MTILSQTPDTRGEHQSGQDVRTQNVVARRAVANIVKSSLGPVGLDICLFDDIGDVKITNDGATILKMLEIEHPAAKVLVELAELQDREVGDGTTSVVIVAAEMLKRANDLVRNKIHPTSIISGYRVGREAWKRFFSKLCQDKHVLEVGGDNDFFANLGINILKAHVKSAIDSYLLNGYALNTGRAAQGMPLRVAPPRIACLDFNLQKTKIQLGVQVLVTNPRELEKICQREADMVKERIEKLLKAGANHFVEAGAIAIRCVLKEDMRRIGKATGATMVYSYSIH